MTMTTKAKEKKMKTDTTTPASVAARMTDLRISTLTQFIETRGKFQIAKSDEKMCKDISAVLRDYVRLRKLANEVKASVAKATLGVVVAPVVFKWDDPDKSWICYDAEGMCRLTTEVEESCINSMAELKRLLAEAEKGEVK